MKVRVCVTASTIEEAARKFELHASKSRHMIMRSSSSVVFLFPGQVRSFRVWVVRCTLLFSSLDSSLQNNALIHRYETSNTFKSTLDRCCEVADKLLSEEKISLKEIIFQENINNEPHILQPALFCVEYAYAMMLTQELNIEPSVLCGHSIGEYVAATLSGVFDWKDALHLIVKRGQATRRLAREGAMLSVRTGSTNQLRFWTLTKNLCSSKKCTRILCSVQYANISRKREKNWKTRRLSAKLLKVNRALHHKKEMKRVGEEIEEYENKSMKTSRAKIPIMSNVSGSRANEDEIVKGSYWRDHMTSTVRFEDNVRSIQKEHSK